MLSYVQNQDDYFLFCHRESMMRVLQTVYCKNRKCCALVFRRNSVYLHCRWLWTTKKKRQVSGKTCCHLNGQIMYIKRCVFHYMRTCGFLKWIYMCVRVCLPMTCTLLSPPKQTSTALPLKQFAITWRNEMYDYILFNLLPAVEDAIQKVNIGADICCSPLLFIIEIRLPYP